MTTAGTLMLFGTLVIIFSFLSNAAAADTSAPSAPENVRVTALSDTALKVEWNASSDNVGVTGYKLYRNGTFVTSTSSLSYTETHFLPRTTALYNVTAVDGAGNESLFSITGVGTTFTENANAPRIWGVTVANVTPNSATVMWTTNKAASSRIHYGTSQSYGLMASDDSLVKTHKMTLTNLTANTQYHVRIRAVANGYTSYYDAGSFVTTQRQASPAGLGVTKLGSGKSLESGYDTYRMEVQWHAAEREKGVWNEAYLDVKKREADQALRNGLEPVILLDYGVDWAQPLTDQYQASYRQTFFGPPDYQSDWMRYAEKIMFAFKGKVTKYEVWNEPDAGYLARPETLLDPAYTEQYWLEHRYTSLVYGARQAAERIDPQIKLIAPVWNHDYHATRANWLFGLGLHHWFDYYGFHIYTNKWNYGKWEYWFRDKYLYHINSLFSQYNVSMPLVLSEFGWPAKENGTYDPDPNSGDGFKGEHDQARAYWKLIFTMLNEQRFSNIMQFTETNDLDHEYSLFWYNDLSGPKAGYYAWRSIASHFSGKTIERYTSAVLENGDVNTYFFPLIIQETGDAYIGLWQAKYDENAAIKYSTLPSRTVDVTLPAAPDGYVWRVNLIDDQGGETSQPYSSITGGIKWSAELSPNTLTEEAMPNLYVARLVKTAHLSKIPTDLAGKGLSDVRVLLTWKAPTDNTNVTGYKVYRNSTWIADVPTTYYLDTEVTSDQSYSYTVRSVYGSGQLSGASLSAPVKTARRLVFTNPGFEQGTSAPDGWTTEQIYGTSLFEWAADVLKSGSRSIKIAQDAIEEIGLWKQAQAESNAVEPVKEQTFGAWMKTDSVAGDGVQPVIRYFNASGQLIFEEVGNGVNKTREWFFKSMSSVAPTDAASMQIGFRLSGSGTVWFDDVDGYEWDKLAPLKPGGVSASAVSSSRIDLVWDASVDDIEVYGYKVYRDGQEIALVTSQGYSDTGLEPSTGYSYTIRAVDTSGNWSKPSLPASATTLQGQPDLIVTDISWSPATPVEGGNVVFSATIKNQGDAATPDGTKHGAAFKVNETTVSWSADYTSSIGPGESVTLTADGGPDGNNRWDEIMAGIYTITAYADDVNRITESDETNNTRNEAITVVLFNDDFEDGDAAGWTVAGGSWSVAEDGTKVYRQSSTDGINSSFTGTSRTDFSVSVRAKITSSGNEASVDLMGRYVNGDNFYFLRLNKAVNQVQLLKKTAGTVTVLQSAGLTVNTSQWYTLELTFNGQTITGYIDGVQQVSVTDGSLSSGKIGMRTNAAAANFDDVMVR